jgi:hypothetical protein
MKETENYCLFVPNYIKVEVLPSYLQMLIQPEDGYYWWANVSENGHTKNLMGNGIIIFRPYINTLREWEPVGTYS